MSGAALILMLALGWIAYRIGVQHARAQRAWYEYRKAVASIPILRAVAFASIRKTIVPTCLALVVVYAMARGVR